MPVANASDRRQITARVKWHGVEREIIGEGNGPIDAFVDAIARNLGIEVRLADYREHAVSSGASAQAAAYVQVKTPEGGTLHGIGMHGNIVTASLRAVASAASRLAAQAATA